MKGFTETASRLPASHTAVALHAAVAFHAARTIRGRRPPQHVG